MAGSARYQVPPSVSQLTSRRVSFRKSVSDETLPAEYLEALEQKRKQLDESIHKYIASKEREFKTYEKELRSRARLSESIEDLRVSENASRSEFPEAGDVCERKEQELQGGSSSQRRRTSSESTTHSWNDLGPSLGTEEGQPVTALQALLSNGARMRRESNALEDESLSVEAKAAIAGLTDRRASIERDKEFAGLFTPNFIRAIDDKSLRSIVVRSSSAPDLESPDVSRPGQEHNTQEQPQASSDLAVSETEAVRNKRPSQLQLTSRTSSSGSSADGRLASALKSPTQKDRARRKRVSLAVGDSIVAPSDNVPSSQTSLSQAPSHSRTRATSLDRERGAPPFPSPLSQAAAVSPSPTSPQIDEFDTSTSTDVENSAPSSSQTPLPASQTVEAISQPLELKSSSEKLSKAQPRPEIDPDGDLFDLEEDDDGGLIDPRQTHHGYDNLDDLADDEAEADIAGRVTMEDLEEVTSTSIRTQPIASTPERGSGLDPSSDFISEANDVVKSPQVSDEKTTVVVELGSSSATSSQHPTRPGFRRPSVHADPVFVGSLAQYASAESQAVEEEVYGSRYVQSGPKASSFRGGSIGESFMERNAAELMRLRNSTSSRPHEGSAEEVRT